jgi:hypothetical protein
MAADRQDEGRATAGTARVSTAPILGEGIRGTNRRLSVTGSICEDEPLVSSDDANAIDASHSRRE